MEHDKRKRKYWRKLGFALFLMIIHRLILTIVSLQASGRRQIAELLKFDVFRQAFYESFARFDAGWYAKIAEFGYPDEKTSAFFPLYPLLMRGVSYLTGFSYKICGQIISLLCFFICLFLIQVLSEQAGILFFVKNKEKAGRLIAGIAALHPMAFFYTIIYTESIFLMLTLLFMLAVSKRKWLLAGFMGFLAGLTRNSGVLLAVIFLFEYFGSILPEPDEKMNSFLAQCRHYACALLTFLRGFKFRYFIRYRSFFAILLIPAGTLLYFIYLYSLFGSFAGPIESQSQFGRSSLFPVLTVLQGIRHGVSGLINIGKLDARHQLYKIHYYLIQMLAVGLFIFAAFYNIRKIPFSYNLFMIFSLLLPLSKPAYLGYVDYFVSFPRYTITLFPYLAAICSMLKGSKKLLIFYLAASIYLLIMSVYYWCRGLFMA